jgi:CDP-diacylglycerol--serine O-phosphatidyltransferase
MSTPSKLSKGIFLLPNLFTMAAMFAGFYSVISAMKLQFQTAAIALFIAMIFDFLDGRVARLTHTQTEFGAQFDSLSDLLCFGIAPALLLYTWSLQALGKMGWLVAFIYAVCTALRLARFNIQETSKRFFYGLSTPAAAAVVASFVWVGTRHEIAGTHIAFLVAIMAIILALLKVSSIPYRSFKDFDFKGKVPFLAIIIALLILVLVSIDPAHVLFAIFILYALSGPGIYLWDKWWERGKKSNRKPED